ncbi:MAG: hypothetical protein RLZZ522_1203 [Verrucomicrobiota bacterium]
MKLTTAENSGIVFITVELAQPPPAHCAPTLACAGVIRRSGGNFGRGGMVHGVRMSGDRGAGKEIVGGYRKLWVAGPTSGRSGGGDARGGAFSTAVLAVDCWQLAAAVGPASLLAGGEWRRGPPFMPQQAASITATASCRQSTVVPAAPGGELPVNWEMVPPPTARCPFYGTAGTAMFHFRANLQLAPRHLAPATATGWLGRHARWPLPLPGPRPGRPCRRDSI